MIKRWANSNKPLLAVAKKYWAISSKEEKLTDIGLPVLISLLFVLFVTLKGPTVSGFLTFSNSIVNTIITVLSILAGFNVAAVSIIASSQSPIIRKMADPLPGNIHSPLEGLVAFFCWAIAIQLMVLLGSIAYAIIASTVLINPGNAVLAHFTFPRIPILLTISFFGTVASLHSLFLSIRNIAGLYLLVIKGASNSNPQ